MHLQQKHGYGKRFEPVKENKTQGKEEKALLDKRTTFLNIVGGLGAVGSVIGSAFAIKAALARRKKRIQREKEEASRQHQPPGTPDHQPRDLKEYQPRGLEEDQQSRDLEDFEDDLRLLLRAFDDDGVRLRDFGDDFGDFLNKRSNELEELELALRDVDDEDLELILRDWDFAEGNDLAKRGGFFRDYWPYAVAGGASGLIVSGTTLDAYLRHKKQKQKKAQEERARHQAQSRLPPPQPQPRSVEDEETLRARFGALDVVKSGAAKGFKAMTKPDPSGRVPYKKLLAALGGAALATGAMWGTYGVVQHVQHQQRKAKHHQPPEGPGPAPAPHPRDIDGEFQVAPREPDDALQDQDFEKRKNRGVKEIAIGSAAVIAGLTGLGLSGAALHQYLKDRKKYKQDLEAARQAQGQPRSIDEDDEEELFWRSLDDSDSFTERDSLDDGDDVTPVTRSLLLDWHDDEVKN